MMGERMSRKNVILIDGSSLLERAFYDLPANGAAGVRSLVLQVMEGDGAEHLAAAFHSRKEKTAVPGELLKQEKLLKEFLADMGIPIFEKEGYGSSDIIASLLKSCQEDGEVVILSGDRKLLQAAGEHVIIRIPAPQEEGLEFKSWSPEAIMAEYGVVPENLKAVLALSGDWGIGDKTAGRLTKQYQSLDNLYARLEEVESQRIREILSARQEEIRQKEKNTALRDDAQVSLNYEAALTEHFFTSVSDTEGNPFEEEGTSEEAPLESRFQVITDLSEAETLFSKCGTDSRLGLQLVVEERAVQALSLCLSETECFCLIPQGFLTPGYLAEKAGEICQKAERVTVFQLKNQLPCLHVTRENPVFDAGIAGYLLNPSRDSYEYHDLAADYLDLSLPSKTDLLGKKSFKKEFEENRENAVTCACYMAYVAFRCGDRLLEELESAGMGPLFYEIDMPLVYSLFHMEEAGIQVERERLKEYGDRLKVRIKELEEKIHQETGENFNINSPKQLGEVLFDHMKLTGGKKTKTGYSTAADVLEKLAPDYPVVRLILDYRQLTKLNSTYADGLAAYIGPDERIHGTFNQTIAATGRISSTEPNLQNIPVRMELGREIRKVFVPKEGCVFLDADYSQIELRVLAHMSGDQRLINAYKKAEDIHAITASEVFHVPLDQVTSLQRRNAKAVNFGIVYGISSFGLSEGLSITRKEAGEYIDRYFETYPGVKAFLDGLVNKAKEQGYAVSMFGRRRPVPELKSTNFMQRSFGERVAMNSPIQGTAADIIKIAMIRVDQALKDQGLKSRIVLQVHDELLVEAYKEELPQVQKLLVEEMKNAAELEVSLEVEANVGDSWFDAK